jgi:5-keto 4-deoxyuronate isomerase
MIQARSLLAQCFAYLHTMGQFSSFVTCPLVIDSPLQQDQDQDKVNAKTIFDFIFKHTLPGQQLIVGTVSLPGVDQSALPADIEQIALESKYGLLVTEQYDEVFGAIDSMHQETLAAT